MSFPACLMVSGRAVDAVISDRPVTLIDIDARLALRYLPSGHWFGGVLFFRGVIYLDNLSREVDVWVGRGLRATVELGTDLAAMLAGGVA